MVRTDTTEVARGRVLIMSIIPNIPSSGRRKQRCFWLLMGGPSVINHRWQRSSLRRQRQSCRLLCKLRWGARIHFTYFIWVGLSGFYRQDNGRAHLYLTSPLTPVVSLTWHPVSNFIIFALDSGSADFPYCFMSVSIDSHQINSWFPLVSLDTVPAARVCLFGFL